MFDEKIKTIKKILYYRDVKLLWRVFTATLKISFISSIRQRQLLNFLISPKKMVLTKNADREKITRYVNLYTFIRSKLGFKETCLTYSLLLCHVLRRAGIDAKMNFGAKKKEVKKNAEDLNLIGHCWVTINKEEIQTPYQRIFTYP